MSLPTPSYISLINGQIFMGTLIYETEGAPFFYCHRPVQCSLMINQQTGQVQVTPAPPFGMESGHEKHDSTSLQIAFQAVAYIIPPDKVANGLVKMYREHVSGIVMPTGAH